MCSGRTQFGFNHFITHFYFLNPPLMFVWHCFILNKLNIVFNKPWQSVLNSWNWKHRSQIKLLVITTHTLSLTHARRGENNAFLFVCFRPLIFLPFYSDSSRILSEVVFEDFGSVPCSLVLVLLIFFFLNVNLMLMCAECAVERVHKCVCVCLRFVESSGWCLRIKSEAA